MASDTCSLHDVYTVRRESCNPIIQYAYKQSTHLVLLGKHAWSWHYRKSMCQIKGHCTILINNPLLSLSDLQIAVHTIDYEEWSSLFNCCTNLLIIPLNLVVNWFYNYKGNSQSHCQWLTDISPGRRWVMAPI